MTHCVNSPEHWLKTCATHVPNVFRASLLSKREKITENNCNYRAFVLSWHENSLHFRRVARAISPAILTCSRAAHPPATGGFVISAPELTRSRSQIACITKCHMGCAFARTFLVYSSNNQGNMGARVII